MALLSYVRQPEHPDGAALHFRSGRERYRASRPDYPDALIDDVISCAGLKPNDPVLEVGCGTGQATKSFAMRGLQIVAIDPGPEMVRAARESLAKFDNVELVESTFEAWPPNRAPFQLVVAAQSCTGFPRKYDL
jgi:ubiquinone/menaquinone biosynthesis C-methylase UbiE